MMLPYKAPLDDFSFNLNQLLANPPFHQLPSYEAVTDDLVDAILAEADRLAVSEVLPLNHSGDQQGSIYENGTVTTPKGSQQAYAAFCEGGWTGLACLEEHGGQALPQTLNTAISEIFSSANLALTMTPGLTLAAYDAILRYGSDFLKSSFLPAMASGVWSGAMCLTEPQCGTDLGLIRTKATPIAAGGDSVELGDHAPAWQLTGSKIFISAGEHDLTENIIYLVLARLPDAPAGIQGLSLFLVPKFNLTADGTAGTRNAVRCASIEHKMGIKASPTCVMEFNGAAGWLVGTPHKGMRAMFTMMNKARIGVAVQGTAISEAAYQAALSYAKERRQGRALTGAAEPNHPADALIVHPDIRRMLLTMQCNAQSCRSLCLELSKSLDIAAKAADPQTRQDADDYVALLTPIAKAIASDLGSESANLAVQIYGGHGYIQDYGVEQLIRDARITQIYEGANGIQALDLIGRKLTAHNGRYLRQFFHPVQAYIAQYGEDEQAMEYILPLAKCFGKLQMATAEIARRGLNDKIEAAAMAHDYMWLFAYVIFCYQWAKTAMIAKERITQERIAQEKLKPQQEGDQSLDFYRRKLVLAQFFNDKILPKHSAHFSALMKGKSSVMMLEDSVF
ncbi:MAG: acyl-CoA dehydrogenase family protein [Alphaproteobacteria bacterium]